MLFRSIESSGKTIDAMLTDVVMPEMSGKVLAERVAQVAPHIKVIFMSGYTDNAIVHHGVLDGGIFFIEKPFTMDSLARKIRDALDGATNESPDA